ncbi:MAG: hypothetical protein K0S40_1235 [Actinomycetospora sp.]|nr:hypothetical protein [Actinomycetospora sp.]
MVVMIWMPSNTPTMIKMTPRTIKVTPLPMADRTAGPANYPSA